MAACFVSFISFISLLFLLILKKLFWVSRTPNLKNKHVLITEGSSGLGKSTAIEASKLGANVTILGRDEPELKKAVEEIRKMAKDPQGQKIQCLVLDVTKGLTDVDEVVQSAEATGGPVFLLVNCADRGRFVEFDKATESDFRCMMESVYLGTVYPSVSVGRRMKKRKEGHIGITVDQSSVVGVFGATASTPSAFALRGFAESLHMELRPHGVSVTLCVQPDTDTPDFFAAEESKPRITRLLSVPGNLFRAEEVSRRLLSDSLRKKYLSIVGLEGFLLTTLCAGMSPVGSPSDVFLEVSLMGFLRLLSVGYHLYFRRTIARALNTGNDDKKSN